MRLPADTVRSSRRKKSTARSEVSKEEVESKLLLRSFACYVTAFVLKFKKVNQKALITYNFAIPVNFAKC